MTLKEKIELYVEGTREGDTIYPHKLAKEFDCDIREAYVELENFTENNPKGTAMLTSLLEAWCPKCEKFTGYQFSTFWEIPDADVFVIEPNKYACPHCGFVDKEIMTDTIVVYKRILTEKEKEIRERNKKLIEKYPFLLPRNRCTDEEDEDFDYSWTELDAMPDGWRKAFGEMMCEEIKNELLKFGQKALDDYRIVEIKEKYAELRWYDNGHPQGSKLGDIIGKYEKLSQNICIHCGKPDVPITGDWYYLPLCRKCYTSDDRNADEEWEAFAKKRGAKMSDVYKYTRFSDGESENVEIDISETANRIRKEHKEENS